MQLAGVRNSEIFSRCDNVLASECRLDTNIANSDTCDFHRITRVASGGKLRHPENIGRFGIGFVSVYQITDYPEIASNGIRLTLFPDQESFNATDAPEIQGTEFPTSMDKFLARPKSANRSILTSAPLFLTHDHRLTRFDEGRRRPEQVSLERLTKWFPSLPLPHRSLEENAHALALANELEPELVVSDLEAACRLDDSATLTLTAKPTDLRVFYRLIRDLMVGRDREANPDTLSSLAALHIFRAGKGFVAAQNAFLPGDFEDPIGVVSLLVKECYDAVTQEFLRDSLGVDRQSLEYFVTTQLPRFFENGPPVGRYKKLLTVLTKHSYSLLDSTSLKDTLRKLRMVPTRDGGWSTPNRTYKHGEELERLLGFGPEWWLDETRTPGRRTTDAFLLDLGVRDAPCAEHLVLAMTELTEEQPPSLEAQKRAESLFYVICDNFARWKEEGGVDLECLEMCKSDAIFPADGIFDEWFCGEDLYGPYRSAAFTSQARFLPFRIMQRLDPNALNFFGINFEPTTDLVIAHLRHCVVEGTAVSPLAYRILNERASDQAGGALIAQLQNEPCVWSEADRRYVEPNRLFWAAPRLGRFGAQVPRQAEEYTKFLSAIGVAEQPTPNQYIGIVKEIADEYRDGQPLADDDAAVVR